MQIHELSRRRRADEGVGSWIANKAVGVTKAAGSALGAATGLTTPNAQAASAGILDPAAKLAAVRDNSDMQRVAKQLAAGWTAEAAKLAKAAPAAATPAAAPVAEPQGSTYDPAKAAANKLAKGQADQQQAQQQMAATKQANAVTNQQDAAIKAAADAAKAKSGFEQTAADKLAIKAAADKGIREAEEKKKKTKKKKLQHGSRYYNLDHILENIININEAATLPPLLEAVAAPPRFKPMVQTKTNEKRVLGEKPTIPAPTTPTKPGAPPGFNAANVMKMPGMPGQPVTPGAITPGAAKPGPAAPPAATPPIRGGAGAFDDMTNRLAKGGAGQPDAETPPAETPPAETPPAETPPAETPPAASAWDGYRKQFLAYVNKKTAIRDASTYQMIGLDQIQKQSKLGPQLDAAKEEIKQAYEAGKDVTAAATEYILIAMAGAQLISSMNRAGQELEQPEVDPNNPDAAAGATGADGAAADGAAPVAGGKILDTAGVQAVFKNNGVDPAVLYKLGKTLQQTSGTTAVNTTGNGTVDNMLKALGFKVT